MNNWNFALIEEIFKKKKSEKSDDRDNALQLMKKLSGEKIHYALELIQNAEDEGSPSIIFVLSDEYLAVINEGRPFNEEDVWGICSIRPGRKKNKIGFFGIGFKSVFNVTEKPQVISNNFNFTIENLVYPRPKNEIAESLKNYYSPEKGAIFILPHSPSLPSPKELREGFQFLDSKLLLFLDNIKHLKFVDITNKSEWEIRKSLEDNSTMSLFDSRNGEETKWKVFSRDVRVQDKNIIPKLKEGIKKTRITVAFPLDDVTRDEVKKSGFVYCYLPTKKRADVPFLIQADFIPTLGRENISDEPWNKWLMEKLGIWAANTINMIRNDEQLGQFIYDFIPLSEEIHDDLIKHLYEPLFKSLKNKEIAKTTKDWQKPRYCVIPDDDRLRDILNEKDLRLLLNKKIFYINRELSDLDAFTRAERVLFELGAKKVGINEVIDFVQKKNAIKSKNKEWFLDLYDYFRTEFDVERKYSWDETKNALYEKFKKAGFILTDNNKLVSLINPKRPDRYICYPQRINLPEIHKIFSEGEIVFLNSYFQESSIARRKEGNQEKEEKRRKVKDWFDSIGVKKYFKEVHIIKEVILPKFSSEKYKEYDDLKIYRLVDYIRRHWATIETEINNKKLSPNFRGEVKNGIRLKAFRNEGKTKVFDYRKPDEIYFSKRYGKNEAMEELFKGIREISFLSSYYLNREKGEKKGKKTGRPKEEYTWKKVFEFLGVWTSPRITKENDWISIVNNKDFSWIRKYYSPHNIHEIRGDCRSEDLKKLVEYCSGLKNQKEIKRRMILLWESLEKNWKLYKEMGIENSTYRFAHLQKFGEYYFTPISNDTSSFLEFLRNANWVPGKDGGFYRPDEVFIETKKNRLLLGEDTKFVSLRANETFLRNLNVRTEPSLEQIVNHLKMFKAQNPEIKENKVEKMQEIYKFVNEQINNIVDDEEKERKIKEIKQIFHDSELLYLPRADKVWWKPVDVFWRDHSKIFGPLRAYIEHEEKEIYASSIKTFLISLGVKERPTIEQALEVLEELRQKNDTQTLKKVVTKVYSYISDQISHGVTEDLDWQKYYFLTKKGNFSLASDAYYEDDEEYSKEFQDSLEFVYLPFSSWVDLLPFLKVARFKSFSENLSIKKFFDGLNEVEGGKVAKIRNVLSFVKRYLLNKNLESYERLLSQGIFDSITRIEIYETSKIEVNLCLKKDESETITVNSIEKDAYYSEEENRLYILKSTSFLSGKVAKEVSRIFKGAEKDVFPFLNSVLPKADDEEALDTQLQLFGIPEASSYSGPEEVELLPEEREKIETGREETEEETKEKETEEEKPTVKPPTPTPQPKQGLIDPNDFIFEDVEERTPYVKTDGPPNVSTRVIKLREGRPEGQKQEYKPRPIANRFDSHDVALELAMRFEELEGREPENRHRQKNIGYDIYSKGKDGEEFFIEVKGLSGETGSWELPSTEWEKAEQEKDNYFVYVVSRLKEESGPIIEIIQNPIKYLTPDPPARKVFSAWENGVKNTISLKKKG
jgi:hypothetical protein